MMNKENKPVAKELTTQKVNSLAYQGKVKLQIARGNKIISTKTYSNNGLPDLFKYLSYALAGISLQQLKPCKIALFDYGQSDELATPPNEFIWGEAREGNNLTEVSPYIVHDASPVVTTTKDGFATTYRFKVPFNWLYRKSFNVLGLFSENNSACAYYLCVDTNTDENGVKSQVWAPVDLSDINGNFSIIVEWTMEISNK